MINDSDNYAKYRDIVKVLDPNKSEQRRELIRIAVQRTIEEYGEALKLLANE